MSKNQNLRTALNYIEENITQPISLYEISKVAGYSVPQFYRWFKKLTGDTVGEYLVRRRTSMAAVDLKESTKSISEIAYDYGFESHDVFTRTFKRVYGVTPSHYSRGNTMLVPFKRLEVVEQEDIATENEMSFRVIDLKEFYVIGMESVSGYWDSDGSIGRLWSEFLSRVNEIKCIISPMIMYGICQCETCNESQLIYMAAVGVKEVVEVPKGMTVRKVKAHKYFQAIVPQEISTPDAYSGTEAYAKSLAYEIDEYDEIEVYEDSFQDPEIHRFKLFIPLK